MHTRFAAVLVAVLFSSLLLTACSSGSESKPSDSSPSSQTTTTTKPTEALPAYAWLTAGSVWVRSGPGPQYDNVGGGTLNERFAIVGKQGDWYEVTFQDKTGWLCAQYLTFTKPDNA